jgi:hypothetical protein
MIACISAVIGLVVAPTSPAVAAVFYWLCVGLGGTIAVPVLSLIVLMIVRRVYRRAANPGTNRAPNLPVANVCTAEVTSASLAPKTSGHFSYAIERLPDCLMEINAHASAHWAEVASRPDIRTLAVDWEAYLAADRAGRVTLGTARRGERLIGYLCMVHRTDLHSKSTVTAESAFYYVERRPMRGLVERNLIRFVLGYLTQRGIRYVRFRNKVSHSNAPILKSLGFVPDEISYVLQN